MTNSSLNAKEHKDLERMELLTHVQIREDLLQAYRGHFLTAHSILLATAAIIDTQENSEDTFTLLVALSILLILIGVILDLRRGNHVTLFQNEYKKLISEKDKSIFFNKKRFFLGARDMFQILIPITFMVIWIVMCIHKYPEYLKSLPFVHYTK